MNPLLQAGRDLLSDEEAEAIYSYAFAHYQSGHFEEAADAFSVLCTRRPFEARFWFGLGASLQEKGVYLDALHAWAMKGLLDPQDPYPHFHAAECYLSLDNLEDAKKALDEALLRIDSSHPLQGKIEIMKKQKEI